MAICGHCWLAQRVECTVATLRQASSGTHPTFPTNVLVAAVFALAALFLLTAGPAAAKEEQKVVIPFDFVSKFDNGRYGQMVGEQIWKKLQRQGGFVIPESMLDVRDTCQQNDVQPSPEMSLDRMKRIVREHFDAQIGIWGSVERAPGHEGEVYDLVIKCVDFSAPGEPKTIYDRSVRTKSVSEIPHLYVKEMLDALYGRKPGGTLVVDPAIEENWKKNPNLLVGGDFQSGSGGVPRGWEPVAGQNREPLGGPGPLGRPRPESRRTR